MMTHLALYDVVRATKYLDQVTDDEYDETDDVDEYTGPPDHSLPLLHLQISEQSSTYKFRSDN